MDSQLIESLLSESEVFMFDLHMSASIGCEESIRDIIEKDEDKQIINTYNKCGWTPLMYAACSTNLKVLLLLLEEGALTDLKNNLGQTAVILASKCGSTDAVSLLIDFRADINIKDAKGWSAVFYASAFGHRSVVQLLSEKGAIVDVMDKIDGLNPLMLSSAAGHEMIVKDLLLMGLNPALKSKSGDTARSLAIKHGHQKVKHLIDTYAHSKTNYSCVSMRNQNCVPQSDLLTVLNDLQLSKYFYIFENQGIDLNTFWMLSDEDLKDIGINLLGPRKKMCLAISKHQNKYVRNSSEDKDLYNKLAIENKQLLEQIERWKEDLSVEIELKKIAERKLNDGIITLKNFTDNVQRTLHYTLALGEKLRQSHANLKKILYCTPDITKEKFKKDIVFPVIEGNEKLIQDIYHQILLSLQQTDFRH